MNDKIKLIILIISITIGMALLFWGNSIMMNYEGFYDIWKEARNAALPQFISAIVIMVGAYILSRDKTK